MKKVRIGAGAGYAGDRIEPALDIIKYGNVDYIIFECLAERTIALAQKEKKLDLNKGYNPLLQYRMDKVIPLLKDNPVKVITNMGAANPIEAAKKIYEIALENNLANLKVAAVIGDDVFEIIKENLKLPIMESNEPIETLRGKIISANAYIGGESITKALYLGADIVVCGRVADPALATGPLMYEFSKGYSDYDFLGKTIVCGHLLECAGQVTGGYYADPGIKEVPQLWNLGFPIIEFSESGDIEIEKLSNSGGLLNKDTVKEQLLYEVQDPSEYFTPDVISDFSNIEIFELEDEKVKVCGATGRELTGTLKVSVGYSDGFIGTGEISYGGYNCLRRGELAIEIIKKRLENLDINIRELRCDLMGVNSLYKNSLMEIPNLHEVRVRIAAKVDTKYEADIIGQEVEALYTNGPAGGGGVRIVNTEIVSIASVLIPKGKVKEEIVWIGGNNNEVI